MKAIIRNMMLGAILVSGLTVLQPSAMAQSATRTARTTQTTNNNGATRSSRSNSGGVSAPSGNRGGTSRNDATVARPATNNRNNATRGGSNREQVSRPNNKNNNSSTANHWPTEGRPNNGTSNSNGYRPGNGTTVNRNNNYNVDPGFSVGGTRGDNNRGHNNGNNNGVGRPDNNRGNNNRGNGGYNVGRPSNNGGSHSNANIGRPGNWTRPVAPPVRQYRPEPRHWTRPVPPPRSFRPHHGAPIIGSVLGLSFGITYYNSLDYLYNRGYCIDGYQNCIVYLRDVREMYCYWPDAELYYDNGCLVRAQFSYSTNYGSTSRYNTLYQNLCGTYGYPVSMQRTGNGSVATWYGGDSRGYVTLEYQFMAGRWFTFLSYGY